MSEWIKWSGGDCPVDGNTIVEVKVHNWGCGMAAARHYNWWWYEKYPEVGDVLEYRVVDVTKNGWSEYYGDTPKGVRVDILTSDGAVWSGWDADEFEWGTHFPFVTHYRIVA